MSPLLRTPLNRLIWAALIALIVASGCGGGRLSSDEARRQILAVNSNKILPDAVQVRRVTSYGDREAIAEATATLAFQFKRDNKDAPWRVAAVRLGDNDWLDMTELLAAINEGRRRATVASIVKLNTGIEAYQRANNALPVAPDIVKLTDLLFSRYMDQLIRNDAWGRPFRYEVSGTTFRLVSNGPNGMPGDADDVTADTK
jgi:hypothetical protein